jgi:sugar lactone lactonase YvrE
MSRRLLRSAIVLASVALAGSAFPASAASFPDSISLPTGFQPEGIAIGEGTTFYVGSIPTGRIFRGDLATGDGDVFVEPDPDDGRRAIGLATDRWNRVWVSGGPTGQGYVYDGETGEEVAAYQFADSPTFINDVEVTRGAAWFTDSMNPFVYRVPIAPDGTVGGQDDVEAVEVTGDFEMQPGFNLNGIEATPNGRTLIVVQSNTGKLFAVDPNTGESDEIDLGDGSVPAGDGLLLAGRRLYVVQNAFDQVAEVRLAPDFESGEIVRTLTDEELDVPTTADLFGSNLYVVNARFGTDEPEKAAYTVEKVPTRPMDGGVSV